MSSQPDAGIYFSLDDARAALEERFSDLDLKRKVRDKLGDKFIEEFGDRKVAAVFRQLCSPDRGLIFFEMCAKYIGAKAICCEYHEDKFVIMNEEKKALVRLKLYHPEKCMIDIARFGGQNGRMICDVTTLSSQSVVDFHHDLMRIEGLGIKIFENSKWFKSIGNASDYYYYFFLHFLSHGCLFENFDLSEGSSESSFTRTVVWPALSRIKDEFGLSPIIVRAFPDNQTDEEDFYWWTHSRKVEEHIYSLAKIHNFKIRPA